MSHHCSPLGRTMKAIIPLDDLKSFFAELTVNHLRAKFVAMVLNAEIALLSTTIQHYDSAARP